SAALFGGMSVGLRMGLNRYPDVELATVATVIGALAVALVAAAAEAPGRGVHAGQAWPFLLAGLLQPGIGQLLVTIAIREAAASLPGGLLLVLAVLGPRVRERLSLRAMLPFLGVGVAFGLSYVSLFEAYYRGRVTVVSPLVAAESLWGVALSLLLIRRTELVGRRVLIGALLIVAGSGLIAAYAR